MGNGEDGGGEEEEVSRTRKEILRLLETPKCFCMTSRDPLSREFPDPGQRERSRDPPAPAAAAGPGPALPAASLPRRPAPGTSLSPELAPDWFFWFSLPPWDAQGDPMTSLAESLPLPFLPPRVRFSPRAPSPRTPPSNFCSGRRCQE